jgi:hypothetical protein
MKSLVLFFLIATTIAAEPQNLASSRKFVDKDGDTIIILDAKLRVTQEVNATNIYDNQDKSIKPKITTEAVKAIVPEDKKESKK